MTLRIRTLLATGLTLAGLIGVLLSCAQILYSQAITESEKKSTQRYVERVLSAISNQLDTLEKSVKDWGNWDDTYEFIEDRNPTYIESNLTPNTFQSIQVNFIIYLNQAGEIVEARGYDLEANQFIPLPQELKEGLGPGSILVHQVIKNSGQKGLFLLKDKPVLFAACPIRTSDSEGPDRGVLIMARLFNETVTHELSQLTLLDLRVEPYSTNRANPPQRSSIAPDHPLNAPIMVTPIDTELIQGSALLQDVYGRPALDVRVNLPREAYQQSRSIFRWYMISMIIVGLVFIGLTFWIQESLVLSRLSKLSSEVNDIGKSGDIASRATATGHDELTQLIEAINTMLNALEHSQAEQKASEQRFRHLVENAPALILTTSAGQDGKAIITSLNPAFESLTGWPSAAWLGQPLEALVHPDNHSQIANLSQVFSGSQPQSDREVRLQNCSGDYITTEIVATPWIEKGDIVGEICIFTDISQRKAAEEQIITSLKEKEVLLREVHHRVKNNLQVMVSLLSLQAHSTNDPQIKEVFRESQNRVRSMALVHEELYRSHNLAAINYSTYITKLIQSLFYAYSNNAKIQLQIEVDPIPLSVDMAIPIGLIVNELISNSLKYAFPDNRAGAICVSLKEQSLQPSTNGKKPHPLYRLVVSDNGIGISPEFDWQHSDSLGLQLVNLLSHQLQATLELDRCDGTKFVLTFCELKDIY